MISRESQKIKYQQARRANTQRNLARNLAQQEQIEAHSNNPYGFVQTMMDYPINGPVGRVTTGMDTGLSNQTTLGYGLLSNKMLGVNSQGESDGCCPKSGPCPNVNPLTGPTCNNSCQVTSNQNNVERSFFQNNNVKTNMPGLIHTGSRNPVAHRGRINQQTVAQQNFSGFLFKDAGQPGIDEHTHEDQDNPRKQDLRHSKGFGSHDVSYPHRVPQSHHHNSVNRKHGIKQHFPFI